MKISHAIKSLKLSDTEKRLILQNLAELEKSGVSKTDVTKLINKITTDASFRTLFLKDPRTAVGTVGIMPGDNANLVGR